MNRVVGAIILTAAVVSLAWWMWKPERETLVTEIVRRDTVVVTRWDTVREPAPVEVVKVKEVVRRLKVYDSTAVPLSTDRAVPQDTDKAVHNSEAVPQSTDTAEVVVPIEQKVYSDSSYTVYVSGYEAQMDSIILRTQREVVRITERKRWSVGVGVGAGIDKNGLVGPMVGISLQYNIFCF